MAATITRLSSEHRPWAWTLTFDFDQAMINAIKRGVPSSNGDGFLRIVIGGSTLRSAR